MGGGASKRNKSKGLNKMVVQAKATVVINDVKQAAEEERAWQQMQEVLAPPPAPAPAGLAPQASFTGFQARDFAVEAADEDSGSLSVSAHDILSLSKSDACYSPGAPRERAAPAAAATEVEPSGEGETVPRLPSKKGSTEFAMSTADRNKSLKPTWEQCGGAAIEQLLEHTKMVDIKYLIKLARTRGAILPRGQDLPTDAAITQDNVHKLKSWAAANSLPVLVLSYPWLTCPSIGLFSHPDPTGWLLRKLVPILEVMLAQATSYAEGATIGVMVDYCSLPQEPRSKDDQARFEAGLYAMHGWYSHPYTHVLMATDRLPEETKDEGGNEVYTNLKGYYQRGWCYYEMRAASLVTHRTLLWDLSKFDASYLADLEPYYACAKAMAAQRPPPMSPDDVAKDLRERGALPNKDPRKLSTSYASDLDTIIGLYRRGFIAAIETFPALSPKGSSISFQGLGWGDAEADVFVGAVMFAGRYCNLDEEIRFNLGRNRFSKAAAERIRDAFGCGMLRLMGI